ncbi:MAG TPA: preprotein translocase subunit SecY [Candidatus Saccharimonadales bacterium]
MSWKTIKQAFKNKDMRKRLAIVVGLVIVYRLLAFIPIPLAEPTQLRQLIDNLFNSQDLLGFINFLSGGALANFSIVLMGLGPYINASIIMQLLTKAVPRLEEINEDGESGRRKINQYTRLLTLPLAIIQSIGILLLIRQQASGSLGIDIAGSASIFQWALMVASLTVGSLLLMWLGELITEQGIGNGISLLIFAGIISQLPQIFSVIYSSTVASIGGANSSALLGFTLPVNFTVLGLLIGFALATVATTYFVVKLNEAQRVVTVSYAKRVRGNRAYGGVDTVLPIKLITAGVIPIIFAVAFLAVPSFVGQLMVTADTAWVAEFGQKMIDWFTPPVSLGGVTATSAATTQWIYPATYFLLVVMFTYFYTGIVFNAKQIAENLQKQGGFVAGIRPGEQTRKFLIRIVNRLNFFGSMSLGFIALLPFFAEQVLGTAQLTIGGTGLLIVVAVALESLRQIESRALMVTYDQA